MPKIYIKQIAIWSLVAFGLSVILHSYVIYAEYNVMSPSGSTGPLWNSIFLFFPFITAVLIIPISIVCMLFKRIRKVFTLFCISAIFYLIGFFICGRIAGHIRMQEFYKLAERSRPLVNAISEYEQKYGYPPENLNNLIPEYLPDIPNTGIGAYPKYDYLSGEDAIKWDENPWVLYVKTPAGGINWDMFIYFPKQNYPKNGYGGWLEKIEDWAYVHE